MDFRIPEEVQKAMMIQFMSGSDTEVRYINGEFIVIGLRKTIQRFDANGEPVERERRNITKHSLKSE